MDEWMMDEQIMNDALCAFSPAWEGFRAPGLYSEVQV